MTTIRAIVFLCILSIFIPFILCILLQVAKFYTLYTSEMFLYTQKKDKEKKIYPLFPVFSNSFQSIF